MQAMVVLWFVIALALVGGAFFHIQDRRESKYRQSTASD